MRGRRRRARQDRRGVALVMVLGAIAVLTIFLTELQEETSAELSSALADRDALKAEYHARSAVNLSRMLIATEPTIRTAIGPMLQLIMQSQQVPQLPVWNFADTLLAPFNSAESAAAFGSAVGIDTSTGKNLGLTGGGRFELKIVDEESKININLGAKGSLAVAEQNRLAQQILGLFNQEQYKPLFEQRDADDQFSDSATICSAIIDWADFDEQANGCNPTASTAAAVGAGVEDNFYQTIGLSYVRKNAAYDSIEELRMVRGMGDDFWATFVDPDSSDPDKRLMTVWGKPEAKINVQTANPLTLLGLICAYAEQGSPVCVDPAETSKFIMGVTLARSFTQGLLPVGNGKAFRNLLEGKGIGGMILAALGVQPIKIDSKYRKDFDKAVSTESRFFSIYAEGVVPGNKRETRVRIHAVIDISGATDLNAAIGNMNIAGPVDTSGTGVGAGTGTDLGQAPQGAYEQAVRINPAGTVVYWRIE